MYTLTDIVNEYLVDIDAGQGNHFARLFNYGVGFLRKKHFDTTGFPIVKELHISGNDTAPLPTDYINWLKIAICVDGRLYSLGENNSICLNKQYDNCGCPVGHHNFTQSELLGTFPPQLGLGLLANPLIADNFCNGEFVGRMFGIGGEGNCLGEFRIDKTFNQIQFAGIVNRCSCILEYLSDLSVVNGDFEVHPFSIDATKRWIRWQDKMNRDKSLAEQEAARILFTKEHKVMKMRFGNRSIDEWRAAFRSGDMAAPKM